MAQSYDEICDRCRILDLESYVELRVERGRGTIAFIEKSSIRKSCALCIQFAQIFKALKTLRARVSSHDSFTLDFRQIQLHESTVVYFRVRFMEFSRVLDFDFDFYPTAALIQDMSSQGTLTPLCRTMKGTGSDLDLARQWLHSCQTSHEGCRQSKIWQNSLRVLDCKGQKLTSINSPEPYACLSYVWGSHLSEQQLDFANAFQDMPETITNAMSVCVALGIPYLWVDRYCIDQNNPTERHHIISNMDRIYQSADLTIVATAGQDPSYGLPGVQTTPRRCQLHLKVGAYTFASTENIREQINTSTWNSRGWTYQEMLLSRRRLVFTDSQMYFQCQCTHYLESLNMAATDNRAPLSDRYRVFPPLEVSSLQRRLAEYYQRHLSMRSDVIHAFSGVCNSALALRSTNLPSIVFSHFYGVPIYNTRSEDKIQENAFLRDLAWRVMHRGSISEPPKFPLTIPTWSWASPKARHQSDDFSGEYVQPPRLMASQSELRPRCMSRDGAIIDLVNVLQHGIDYTSFYPQLFLDGVLLKGRFEAVFPAGSIHGTAYFDSQEPLNLNTIVAMYLGDDETTLNSVHETYDAVGPHTHRVICLLLQPLTSGQQSAFHGNPKLFESKCYRRVGLWIRDTPNHVPGSRVSSEGLMNMVCEQMRTASSNGNWSWHRQELTLV